MKSLHFTIRNIVFLIVLVVLVGTTLNLLRNQTRKSNALSQTTSPPATAIAARPQESASTETAATKTPTPRVYFAYPTPGPTYTPTSVVVEAGVAPPAIKVVDRQLLPLNQLRPLSSMSDEDVPTYALFEAVGWTEQGEVVLQEQNLIERGGAYFPRSLYQVVGAWAISPNDGEVAPFTNWTPSTVIVEGFMDNVVKGPMWVIHGYNNEGISAIDWTTIPTWTATQRQLANEWTAKKPITFPQYWYASPDGETVILHIRKDKVYILKPGQPEPVILPKDKGDIKSYVSGVVAQLSPDGQRVAYGVRFDNPDIDDGYGRKTDTYEIQVSSLDGKSTAIIEFDYEYSYPRELAWSPDGEHIAFIAQSGDHSPLHLYVAKSDGLAVTDLTPDDFWAEGPLHWSKDGQKIVYTSGNPNKSESVGYWITTFSK